jgi:septal ring-binding cell division protein DamX
MKFKNNKNMKTININKMKTVIKIAIAIVLFAAAPAYTNAKLLKTNKYVITNKAMATDYSRIEIQGNVDVILVQGTSNNLTIEGYQTQLANVAFKVENNTLYVTTVSKIAGEKPIVYIPVSALSFIKVQGNSDVKTLGALQTNNLVIDVASECHVAIKSTGNITISDYSSNEYSVVKDGAIKP